MMNKFKWAMLLAVLIISGCEKAENLESSVNSRWSGITGQNLEKSYNYFSPGYKATETIESYKLRIATAQINLRWKKGQFVSADCEEETVCKVKVLLDYEYTFPKRSLGGVEVQTNLFENWIKLDNKWYFVPKDK